jgi:hypothetical protein
LYHQNTASMSVHIQVCDESTIYLHRPGTLVKLVVQSGGHSQLPNKEVPEAPHINDTISRHAVDIMRSNDCV